MDRERKRRKEGNEKKEIEEKRAGKDVAPSSFRMWLRPCSNSLMNY